MCVGGNQLVTGKGLGCAPNIACKFFFLARKTGTCYKIWNAGTRILVREQKSFEKARGNAEREKEMKVRDAGTRHAKGLQERAPSSVKNVLRDSKAD